MNEQLLADDQTFARIFEVTPVALCLAKLPEGRITQVNEAWTELVGYTREETLGKSASDLGLYQDPRQRGRLHRAFASGEKVRAAEVGIRTKSGESRVVSASADQIEIGGAVHILVTIEEISNRKAAEEALRRSEAELLAYAEAMPQIAFIADANGDIIYNNRRHLEYFGVVPGATEGWRWTEVPIHHPDDLQRTVETWTRSLRSGTPYEIEYRLRRFDGVYRWHLGRATPVRDEHGIIVRWFGTNTDIDDQKRITEELDRTLKAVEFEKARFEAVMKQMPAAVIIGEAPSGRLLFSNDKMIEVWGHEMLPKSEIDKFGMWIGFHRDGRRYRRHEWPLVRSIVTGEVVRNEDVDIIRGDGRPAVLRLNSSPILDRDGRITAGVVICQDVTELVESIRSRDDFLSICSHELKTPLTSLQLSTQLMKHWLDAGDPRALAPERVDRLVTQTVHQVGRIARLVDDMLDVSRISAGKLAMELQKIKFSDVVRDVIDRLRPTVTESGALLQVELGSDDWCMADPFRLEQVVVNLLTNAARYGNGRPIAVRVIVRDGVVLLTVADKGIGIAKPDRKRIFERFERVAAPGSRTGLGLGLFISRQIVESLGGRIWVESQAGEGSTFFVELPAT